MTCVPLLLKPPCRHPVIRALFSQSSWPDARRDMPLTQPLPNTSASRGIRVDHSRLFADRRLGPDRALLILQDCYESSDSFVRIRIGVGAVHEPGAPLVGIFSKR